MFGMIRTSVASVNNRVERESNHHTQRSDTFLIEPLRPTLAILNFLKITQPQAECVCLPTATYPRRPLSASSERMAAVSGLLNAISKVVPYVSLDRTGDDLEDHEPLLPDIVSAGYLGEDEGRNKSFRQSVGAPHLVRKANSEVGVHGRTTSNAPADLAETVIQVSSTSSKASLRPSYAKCHRSSRSSEVETRSQSKRPSSLDTNMHMEIMARLSNIRDATDLSKTRGEGKSKGSADIQTNPQARFQWSSPRRSKSNADSRKAYTSSMTSDLRKPLKSCSKQKAKSANTMPPNASTADSRSTLKLRRIKTVNFDETISKPVLSWMQMSSNAAGHRRSKRNKASKCDLPCPGTAALAKRSPAGPAVTRTDVHVIAIAPATLKSAGMQTAQPEGLEDSDPATPTMQIVESSNGNYEVIWDDVPPEHSARVRRRSSSASQALQTVSSTATRGLERVNMKLTEWSGTWNTPSDSFKPTIVVFPDDDGRRPHFECAIVDSEDTEIFVPPNSKRVSAAQSRHPSRPVSARMSRAAFQDGSSTAASVQKIPFEGTVATTDRPLVVPDPDAWSSHLVAARRKLGAPIPERMLSNIEEGDVKFRNHRDSVAIAHSRLIHSRGVRPELFAHRDSLSMAKKRMHARNHSVSTSRAMHCPDSKLEPEIQLEGDVAATAIPPLPVVKAHAAEALKHGLPVPILRPSGSFEERHIRIEDRSQVAVVRLRG